MQILKYSILFRYEIIVHQKTIIYRLIRWQLRLIKIIIFFKTVVATPLLSIKKDKEYLLKEFM